jgi:hypothetical protein
LPEAEAEGRLVNEAANRGVSRCGIHLSVGAVKSLVIYVMQTVSRARGGLAVSGNYYYYYSACVSGWARKLSPIVAISRSEIFSA